jgi:methyl-accepting chemotaxis protein
MALAFSVVIITTIAAGAVGVVSQLILNSLRNDMLTRGDSNADIIAASHQHLLFTAAIIGGVIVICLIVSIVFAARIVRSIRIPVDKILYAAEQVGLRGDYTFSEEFKKSFREEYVYDDELGRLSQSFGRMMIDITAKAEVLETAATGDLTKLAPALSESDTLANATNTLIGNLQTVTSAVRESVGQMNAGIAQISQGAQSLAQSTMEQSMTMSRLMGTLGELSSQAADNAEHSRQASDIAAAIWDSAGDGRASMEKMTQAMAEISEASQSISAVMKAIDSIAFQTNILSLNAAVEAARAGQHGKGFAVVADEVRNLAAKSADAAKDSAELVEDTKNKSSMGSEIVKDTSAYLDKIMGGVSESASLLKNIAAATAEQNESIEAINKGFEQLTDAMHQNSATAEESAAATEEMNSQAEVLLALVSHFRTEDSAVSYGLGEEESATETGYGISGDTGAGDAGGAPLGDDAARSGIIGIGDEAIGAVGPITEADDSFGGSDAADAGDSFGGADAVAAAGRVGLEAADADATDAGAEAHEVFGIASIVKSMDESGAQETAGAGAAEAAPNAGLNADSEVAPHMGQSEVKAALSIGLQDDADGAPEPWRDDESKY